jgi:hypothetical protein
MKRWNVFIFIGIILAAGTAAFCVGRKAALRQETQAASIPMGWLKNASANTVAAERSFERQTRQWTDAVRAKQAALASMLPDNRFTSEQILAQVDSVAQSYATLAESVGGHLARLRNTLPEPQKQLLVQSCSQSLRGSMQRRYRWRGGAQGQADTITGGRRGGWRQGAGGRGKQYRGGWSQSTQGPARGLPLTPEQNAWIRQQDPSFEDQCVLLRDRLYQAQEAFVAAFDNVRTTDKELAAKIADFVAAHSALEKRVAQYLMLLRPQLSPVQRELLSELCRGQTAVGDRPTSKDSGSLGDSLAGLFSLPVLADLV